MPDSDMAEINVQISGRFRPIFVAERCVPDDGRPHALINGHHHPELCCAELVQRLEPRLIGPSRWDIEADQIDEYDPETGPTTQQITDSRWHEINEPRNGR